MSSITVNSQEVNSFIRPPVRVKAGNSNGNFVVHVPLAKSLLDLGSGQQGDEFTHLTYTAVTDEIEIFPIKYQLRQRLFQRPVKVALVITMYNESPDLFIKSMKAVQKNIAYLCSDKCPFSWGMEGWKHFVVVIVSDGRAKIHPKVLTVLELMGLYLDTLPRSTVDNKPIQAHIFEGTTQVSVNEEGELLTCKSGIVPTQVIFILKEQNKKKINSHKWFFTAVCETIKPSVCMLLDVGTKPAPTSLMHLYRAFERNPLIGGACGEIVAELGSGCTNLFNPLVAAQNFEYKMSNILDKPLESVFGYISVLPGAFSAYRFNAVKGRPLEQYFLGEAPGANIFTSNLYLAEDRILCFELITKKSEPWLLKYAKDARAETDVPSTLDELTSQRRRWLNGSFFASLYSLLNWKAIYTSPHSTCQKTLFTLEFVYNAVNIWFTWFALANFYLTFFFLFNIRKGGVVLESKETDPFFPYGDIVFQTLQGLYLFGVVAMIVTSLGNRPRGTRWLYRTMCFFFSCLMVLMIFMSAWSIKIQVLLFTENNIGASYSQMWNYLVKTPEFRDMVFAVGSTYGLYVLSSLLALDPWHCLTCMVQYLILIPTYINIFNVFAFCNLHDVSWGTKGSLTVEADKKEAAVVKKTTSDGQMEFEYSLHGQDHETKWKTVQKKFREELQDKVVKADKRDDKTKKEDAAKSFRTRVVLFWLSSNCLLAMLFTNEGSLKAFFPNRSSTVNPYLTFLFFSFLALASIRFIGSVLYLVDNFAERVNDRAEASERKYRV